MTNSTRKNLHLARRVTNPKTGKVTIMCRCSDYVPVEGTMRVQQEAQRDHRRAMGEKVGEPYKHYDVRLKEARDRIAVLEATQTFETSCLNCAENLALMVKGQETLNQVTRGLNWAAGIISQVNEICDSTDGLYDATPDWVRRIRQVVRDAGQP